MPDINLPKSLPGFIQKHLELYLADGEAGHLYDASVSGGKGMLTTLLLFTTGRKSGKKLIIPLIYRPTGEGGYCIIASKGGAPAHPAWFLNLQAKPEAQIKIANDEYNVKARISEGEERERLWQLMANYYAPYSDYQAATERKIPVVILDPVK